MRESHDERMFLGEIQAGADTATWMREDGARVSMPSGRVIEPPFWTRYVLERIPEIVREIVREELAREQK